MSVRFQFGCDIPSIDGCPLIAHSFNHDVWRVTCGAGQCHCGNTYSHCELRSGLNAARVEQAGSRAISILLKPALIPIADHRIADSLEIKGCLAGQWEPCYSAQTHCQPRADRSVERHGCAEPLFQQNRTCDTVGYRQLQPDATPLDVCRQWRHSRCRRTLLLAARAYMHVLKCDLCLVDKDSKLTAGEGSDNCRACRVVASTTAFCQDLVAGVKVATR